MLELKESSAEAVRGAGLSPGTADEALKLYEGTCTRCHKSYDPHAYTPQQWESWMTKMSRKAHLDKEQQDLLARYLGAVRATSPPENNR